MDQPGPEKGVCINSLRSNFNVSYHFVYWVGAKTRVSFLVVVLLESQLAECAGRKTPFEDGRK